MKPFRTGKITEYGLEKALTQFKEESVKLLPKGENHEPL